MRQPFVRSIPTSKCHVFHCWESNHTRIPIHKFVYTVYIYISIAYAHGAGVGNAEGERGLRNRPETRPIVQGVTVGNPFSCTGISAENSFDENESITIVILHRQPIKSNCGNKKSLPAIYGNRTATNVLTNVSRTQRNVEIKTKKSAKC